MVGYSGTIEVYDVKVDIYSQLNESMDIYMYQRSMSFFDVQGHSDSIYFKQLFPEATGQAEVKLHIEHS